jgi:hypothetical protein
MLIAQISSQEIKLGCFCKKFPSYPTPLMEKSSSKIGAVTFVVGTHCPVATETKEDIQKKSKTIRMVL